MQHGRDSCTRDLFQPHQLEHTAELVGRIQTFDQLSILNVCFAVCTQAVPAFSDADRQHHVASIAVSSAPPSFLCFDDVAFSARVRVQVLTCVSTHNRCGLACEHGHASQTLILRAEPPALDRRLCTSLLQHAEELAFKRLWIRLLLGVGAD